MVYGFGGELIRHTRLAAAMVADVLAPYLEVTDLDFSCVVDDMLYVRDPDANLVEIATYAGTPGR